MKPGELARLSAALDDDELTLAAHLHINELPLVTAARALGWSPYRVDRTRKRLQRKLRKLARTAAPPARRVVDDPPQHSYPQFFERLSSGRRLWSMRALPQTYLDIMLDETPITLKTQEVSRTPIWVEGTNMKSIEKLRQELTAESAKLGRIQERAHNCHLAVSAAERGLELAQAELKADQIQAVLEERASPSPELKKRLAVLQNALAHATAELEGAREAQRIQAAKVAELESETQGRELEAHRIIFEPARKQLYEAFATMIGAAAAVDKTLETTGPADLTEILFRSIKYPGSEWPDYDALAVRNAFVDLLNIALRASRLKGVYDPKKEIQIAAA